MVTLRWDGLESGSTETCTVRDTDDGVLVEAVVRGPSGDCAYTLSADARWRFRALDVRLGGRSVHVRYDVDGAADGAEWTVDGQVRRDLAAAREVDLAASPLTNTLPIRRLVLEVGQSADITTAWVAVPELTVVADPQRYSRLGDRQYRFESRDSDFERVITVDEHGLVVSYPGLFARSPG
ncbi:putative glycolipid-binding domain-containing protein [Puerhibacterium puerhi]|uniref:putative glycolipid-binding domain-containing protein n=1 Tax=Puerhibacterium puerhi TaxID=2692623 RepID=UPI0019152239|nr:putative glycolipid-binding domain-containing protein [Puerhibacterium puerhi]